MVRSLSSLLLVLAGTWAGLVPGGTGIVRAASMDGFGELEGRVHGTQPDALAVVFAHEPERDVAYTVFVVDGRYRATNLFPGRYRVTVRPAVGQLKGFTPVTTEITVGAGARARADFTLTDVRAIPNYVGGVAYDGDPRYPDGKIRPYDEIYPPGPGRDILERTCNACHQVNLIPYNAPRAYSGGRPPKDRAAWATTVDNMHKVPAFGRPGKASMFDAALLPPRDREVLLDYLAANFGPDSEPRVVQLDSVPTLDKAALAKAMFVEYNYREPKGKYPVWPWPHQVDFDRDGNVWLAYTACCIVRLDPRTGETRAFEGHGGGHGIAVDQTDGTVWYSGDVVRRLDPKTGLVDRWRLGNETGLGSNTQIFDSKGNLWLSFLPAGGLGKWDRATDSVMWWEVPVVRARPYGIIVDHRDKVWWADYHNGGLTRFDPETEEFRHFRLVREHAASSIRRLGVDSKNRIWAGTYASEKYVDRLYRLDPDTGVVKEWRLEDLPYAAIYNTEADSRDRIWLSNDNYLSMFDPAAERFTHYPIPVRSDTLKTTIDGNDVVWFFYRNAGKYINYGGTIVALHTDKDRIRGFGAFHSPDSAGHQLATYRGPLAPPVRGEVRVSPPEPRNAGEYRDWAQLVGLMRPAAATDDAAGPSAAGARLFAERCAACHTLPKGGSQGLGPNLHGVVGARAASKSGFAYSDALRGAGITWTAEALDRFLAGATMKVPGTSMVAPGITDPVARRALVEFLGRGSGAAEDQSSQVE